MKVISFRKRRFVLYAVALLLVALIGIPLYVNAEENVTTYHLYHKHVAGCKGTVYKTIVADTTRNLVISGSDTCSCGGYHDYYSFTGVCSCGKTWYTTGHACVNSPYGSNKGTCSNYSVINCNTSHSHPVTEYVCGNTQESIIETITVSSSTLLPAHSVTLTATREGLLEEVNLTWADSEAPAELTVSENGTYHLYAAYRENGIDYMSDIEVEVNNIDYEPPVVSDIVSDKQDFTSDNIILSIEAEDAAGLPENYISWNGEAFSGNNQYEISENGTYEVTITDIAGNTVVKSITVENIDKTAPEIVSMSYNPQPWYSGECKVTVSATDRGNGNAGSGLAAEPYSWDEGVTWTAENTVVLSEPGSVSVWVRDAVGNATEKEIEVLMTSKPVVNTANPADDLENDEENMMIVPIVETKLETADNQQVSYSEPEEVPDAEDADVTLQYQFLPERVMVEGEMKYDEGVSLALDVITKPQKSAVDYVCIGGILAGILAVGLFMLMLYLRFGMCKLYETDYSGKETYLGRVGIRRSQKKYITSIPKRIISKANTRTLVIKLPARVVKRAGYKPYTIIVGENVIDKYIEKEIKFHIQM